MPLPSTPIEGPYHEVDIATLRSWKPAITIGEGGDTKYHEKRAVRVLVVNDKNEIVIIYAKDGEYFRLPGGDIKTKKGNYAVAKEAAMEDIGCEVYSTQHFIATSEEWRGDLHEISFCYIAHFFEDSGSMRLTEKNMADGQEHDWVEVKTAIQKMKDSVPTSPLGASIRERDLFFVSEYSKLLDLGLFF